MIKNEEGYMDPTYAGAYKTILEGFTDNNRRPSDERI